MATRKGSAARKTAKRAGGKAGGGRKGGDETRRGRKAAGRKAATGRRGAAAKSTRGARKTEGARKGASRGRKGRAARANALVMLKDDHDRVQEMFDRFERARSEDQKQQLAERICDELTTHAEVEEEIFYPAVREATGEGDLVDEAEVEHAAAKDLIAQIRAGRMGDPQWEAKVKVLGEYVKHHIKEEQKEMFPLARKAKLDLRELGERIAARKAGEPMPAEEPGGRREAMPRTEREADTARREGEDDEREPGLIESAVRTLLPGGRG